MDYSTSTATVPPRRTLSFRTLVLAVVLAFAVGAAGIWYYLGREGVRLGDIARLRAVDSPAAAPTAAAPAPAAGLAQQGALDQRVAAMEQRLARLDLQAQAAAGNAGRAEGLLIVFASRRAIERGTQLGYLEDQLRLRFGGAQPDAVSRIIASARSPITLDDLIGRLDALQPQLASAPADEGMIARLRRELGEIFVVRREGTPSPAAERRLERARLFLASGRAEAAIAEVQLLPNAGEARQWLADAGRFAGTQRALDLLETTAILDPRALRDSAGTAIEQPSPVEGAPVAAGR